MCYKKVFLLIGVSMLIVCNSIQWLFNAGDVVEKGNIVINHDKKLIIEGKEKTRESRSDFGDKNSGLMILPIEDVNETIVIEGL